MSEAAGIAGIRTLPREDYVIGIEPSDMPMETAEEYFERLEREHGVQEDIVPDEAEVCREAHRRLRELQEERRQLLWSLLRHPIASPSGLVGISIGVLALTKVVGATVAMVGELVNAGIACYLIQKKVRSLQREIDQCQRFIAWYREEYGDLAADILSADIERGVESGD